MHVDLIAESNLSWLWASYGGMSLVTWLLIPVLIVLAYGLGWAVGRLSRFIVQRNEERHVLVSKAVKTVAGPVDLLLGVWFFRMMRVLLDLTDNAKVFLGQCETAIATVGAAWLLLRLTRIASDRLGNIFDRSGRPHAKAVIPLLRKVATSAIVLVGFMFLLSNIGVDVAAMLAGLGIGGLALALAGQKTVENLFAGVSLVMDQPARVGETCKYGDSSGTIEDIGLRSTRIRTPDRTVVTIPNSKLAEMQIENLTSRDRILLKSLLSLRSETTPTQMRGVLKAVKELLDSRRDITPGGRIRFVAFTQTSLDLELFAYVATRDYNEFLRVREDVFLQIMDIVSKQRTAFAAPSAPVMIEADSARVRQPRQVVAQV